MTKLLVDGKVFKLGKFAKEEELEEIVVKNSSLIFGPQTVYFDIKKRVRSPKGDILSIPDGYVISFADPNPRLYVIENEISTHDYEDIGNQLWRFAMSFKEGSIKIKRFLLEELKKNKELTEKVQKLLVEKTKFPNFSELLDFVVFEVDYGFIVVIDERTEQLNFALKQLAKQPEVIELKKYVNINNPSEFIFRFSGFQEEIREAITKQIRSLSDVDTIVCPANEDGFNKVFLGENRWYAVRMSPFITSQIKYVAMYETAPKSQIKWIGYVQDIQPYKDTGKFEIILSKREELTNPLKLTPQEAKRGIAPQGPRYTKMELIKKAKKLTDLFYE